MAEAIRVLLRKWDELRHAGKVRNFPAANAAESAANAAPEMPHNVIEFKRRAADAV